MAKLERVTAKVFASDAPADKIGQFGSALAGTKLETGDVSTIQALPAYTEGWSSAVISQRNYPVLQETNGVMKNMSYQTAYIMQNGIAEYDPDTEYCTGSICKGIGNTNQYASWGDENVGNAVTNSDYWKNVTPVNYSNITNCLLEVPQRIKYDLTDGTLTIKAGSVVIVPYGTEDKTSEFPVGATFLNDNFKVYDTQYADGKFFVWAEIVEDIVRPTASSTSACTRFLSISITNNVTGAYINGISGSGAFDTSGSMQTLTYYRTDTNIVNFIDSAVISQSIASLPIMLTESNLTYYVASISQVFNGFGYIGSTIWVDKGVKGLIPNGRNEDGSLRNIEVVTNKISINTCNDAAKYCGINSLGVPYFADGTYYYNKKENTNIQSNIFWAVCVIADIDVANGNITSFNPKQPFRAVDYSETIPTRYDGQWVNVNKQISSSAAVGTYTMDISSWLPEDNYNYEVLLACQQTSRSSGGSITIISSDLVGQFIIGITSDISVDNINTFTIPVGSSRTLTKEIQTRPSDANLVHLMAYRRIGTNV